MRQVSFFSGAKALDRDWPRMSGLLREVAERGIFTSGPMVARLEEEIRRHTGAGSAVACGSGTDALILALRAAGIGPGDEVIVPAYTFFASVSSILHAGGSPVMVDVLPGSYAMDPERAAAAITPRTKAIMPVHLFSQTADLIALKDLADRHGLQMIEDSAEAIGMRVDGRHAGLWGRAGVLSFFPTKTLGALGDAGMVLTDDAALADRVRRMRGHDAPGHELLGWNSRCDEIQAAILLTRLERLDADIARRAELAARYSAGLGMVVETPWQATAKMPSNLVWYVYLIETSRRDELAEFLAAHGVGTEIYYPRPLTEQPCLRDLPGARHPVPVAKRASERALALPLYPDLTDEQVDHVCRLIHQFQESPQPPQSPKSQKSQESHGSPR